MRSGHHDIKHQRFTHTRLWPLSQRSFAAARNLHTASDDWTLRKLGNDRGYESVSYVARHCFLHCWRSTYEATMQYTLVANFASRVGPCKGMVEPLKHLLRVTAHPHFLALELRAPMGACSGQYGILTWNGCDQVSLIYKQKVCHLSKGQFRETQNARNSFGCFRCT